MSDNTLEIGQVRVGWLYPGEVKEGAGIPATLVRDKNRVQALISTGSFLLFKSCNSLGNGRDWLC